MGCAGSRFEALPVTGHQSGLSVIDIIPVKSIEKVLKWDPENDRVIQVETVIQKTGYMRSGPTILQLLEKTRTWSGEDDSTIKDIYRTKWFNISGSAESTRVIEDINRKEICGYQRKLQSKYATAYITIKDQTETTMVIATIKRKSNSSLESSADIYLHDPAMNIDNVTTTGLPVTIYVEGDMISKNYDFMMGNVKTNPFKIARAARKWKDKLTVKDSYFLEIGQNVDVAFICMCALALDELFSENLN